MSLVWLGGRGGGGGDLTGPSGPGSGFLSISDKGYAGHPHTIKCRANEITNKEKRGMQARVHHKMSNGWRKTCGILSQVFCHSILRHGDVFWACTVVTQLTIEKGESLFEVEYSD